MIKFNARKDIPLAWMVCSVAEMARGIGDLLLQIQQKCGWIRVMFLAGVIGLIGLTTVYEWLGVPVFILVWFAVIDLAWRVTR